MAEQSIRGIYQILAETFGLYKRRILLLVLLGFLGGAFDGIGINAVVPLLSFLTNGGAGATDAISHGIQALFALMHVRYTFRYLLVFIASLFLFRAFSLVAFNYIRGRIGADFINIETKALFNGVLRATWPYLLGQKLGYVQNTLTRDILREGSLVDVIGQVIQSFTGFVMYLLVAINISLPITLSTLVAGGILLFVFRPLVRKSQVVSQEYVLTEKEFSQHIGEHVIGMKTVKASGQEYAIFEQGRHIADRLRRLYLRAVVVRSLGSSFIQPFSIIFIIGVFAVVYRSPSFSLGAFAATLYLIQKIFSYLESGQAALHSIGELVPYAQNVNTFKQALQHHREIQAEAHEPFALTRAVEFHDVHFSHEDGTSVLEGVTFQIKRSETVGLIGPSGAGKTSIADLLLRLFVPTKGKVLIDGVPLDTINLEKWREAIGYVSQDVFLLNASIEENIRFYRDTIPHEQIVEVAEQANIYDFILSLPEGFKTVVGERGVKLSGGQRQRIALARALAGHPLLLLLDEATSALDTESEKLIHEALSTVRGHITTLVIAHRLSTIADADRILVLERGHITEDGSPEELLKDPDSYYARHLMPQ